MTSFPGPDSPSSNTVVSVDATRSAFLTTSLHESDCPTGRAASPSCCSWLSQIHRTRASSRWCRSPSSARAIFGTALCAAGLTARGEVASIDVPLIEILLGAIPPRDHAQISQTLVVPYHGQGRPGLKRHDTGSTATESSGKVLRRETDGWKLVSASRQRAD